MVAELYEWFKMYANVSNVGILLGNPRIVIRVEGGWVAKSDNNMNLGIRFGNLILWRILMNPGDSSMLGNVLAAA